MRSRSSLDASSVLPCDSAGFCRAVGPRERAAGVRAFPRAGRHVSTDPWPCPGDRPRVVLRSMSDRGGWRDSWRCHSLAPAGARSSARAAWCSNAASAGSRRTSTSAAASSGTASTREAMEQSRATKSLRRPRWWRACQRGARAWAHLARVARRVASVSTWERPPPASGATPGLGNERGAAAAAGNHSSGPWAAARRPLTHAALRYT